MPTGDMNTAIGCTSLNCGFSITGDFGKSAPKPRHEAHKTSGVQVVIAAIR